MSKLTNKLSCFINRMGCVQSQIKLGKVQERQVKTGRSCKQLIFTPSEPLKTELRSFSSLIQLISKQLALPLYSQSLDAAFIKQILDEAEAAFLSVEQRHSLLQMVLDYMALCKNQALQKQVVRSKLKSSDFITRLGQRWLKLKNEIYFSNNDTLKILSFLNQKEGQCCYFRLKFDFSDEEILNVAKTVKQLCRYDLRAFAFLSNYLYRCCVKLESEGKAVDAIEQELMTGLDLIGKAHPPAPPLSGDQQLFLKHQSFKMELQESERVFLELDSFQPSERQAKLVDFIVERAEEAGNQYNSFVELIKDACTKDGYHFKSGLKLKNVQQKRALQRVQEKMLNKSFQKFEPPQTVKGTLEEYIQAEQQAYNRTMQEIYQGLSGKLQFKVSDMLRAKCMFASIDKINECCEEIKKVAAERGLRILEIDNRLQGKTGTSDIVVKMVMGRTVAELQLVIDLNVAAYEFSHKLYQITRSKFFTPLTMLKVINEQLSFDYFRELGRVIAINVRTNQRKYQGRLTYAQAQKSFEQFVKLLPIPIPLDFQEGEEKFLAQFFERLTAITAVSAQPFPGQPIHRNNAEFKIILKEYDKAMKECNVYNEQMEPIFQAVLKKDKQQRTEQDIKACLDYACGIRNIGRIFENKGLNDKAIDNYSRVMEVLQQTATSNPLIPKMEFNIAWLLYKKCNFEKALEYYQRILRNQEAQIGKENLEYASTLNNIGLVFYGQGKYADSLEVYEQSLRIREKLLGKGSIECTSTLNNIGLVYNSQGKYPEAVMNFQRCLEIKERVKGRESTDCALTLNNIGMAYSNQGKLREALAQYTRSLEIREAVKGPDNIDCATTLSNIGLLYYRQGEFLTALEYLRRSLSIRAQASGEESIDCASNYTNIGEVYLKQDKWSDARVYFERALRILEKVKGKENASYASCLMQQAMVDVEDQRFERAEEGLNCAQEIILRAKGKDCINYAQCCQYRGIMLLRSGRLDEAEQQILAAVEFYERTKGKESISSIDTNVYLGQIEFQRRDYSAARKRFQAAIDVCLKADYCFEFYAEARKGLGDILFEEGNFREALREYESGVAIGRKCSSRTWGAIEDRLTECARVLPVGNLLAEGVS